MATKTLTTVVALTVALTLSIAGTAMADAVLQGGFESFGDGDTIGEGAVIDMAGEVALGFGAPLNSDLAALDASQTAITATAANSGLNSASRGGTFTFDWSNWNDGDVNPGDIPIGDNFFVAIAVLNNTGTTDLRNTTGITFELASNAGGAKLQATISDGTDSYASSAAGQQDVDTSAGGKIYTFDFDPANWEFSDGTDVGFSTVLGNAQRIGFSFLLPKINADTEPTTTIVFDNITITPEPTSMIMLGAGCMLLMGSRKLRKA